MVKIKLIIMDEDKMYLEKLANYIFINYSDKFIIKIYSSIDKIKFFLSHNEFSNQDIYLMDSNLVFKLGDILKFKPIIFSSNPSSNEINKYISGKEIINKVIEIYAKREIVNEILEFNNKTKLIGFYSPIGGIGVTTLSLVTSILLGEKENDILFISFETNTSLNMILDEDKDNTLSKYFYYLLTNKDLLIEKLKKENLSKYKNIYYIYPFESILDYDEITKDEVNTFLSVLKENTNFKKIIIDIPSIIDKKNFEIIKEVDEIIMLTGRKPYDYYKMNNFKKEIDRLGSNNLISDDNGLMIINKYKEDNEYSDDELNPFNLALIKVHWCRDLLEKNNGKFDYNISGDFKSAISIIVDKI